jgi:hypothetical protein
MIRRLMRLTLVFICALSLSAGAAERKTPTQINITEMTTETQKLSNNARRMDMAWWVPYEFWESVLMQDPAVTAEQAGLMLEVIQPYFVIAVVQADISPFGAFNFLDEKKIRSGIDAEYMDEIGGRRALEVLDSTSNDFELLLMQIGPVLSSAMGNLGQNFQFYSFSAVDKKGDRIASPYENGVVRISLNSRENEEPSVFEFEAPLDSLHVPRICPNGKPAHISWKVCPWDGSKL